MAGIYCNNKISWWGITVIGILVIEKRYVLLCAGQDLECIGKHVAEEFNGLYSWPMIPSFGPIRQAFGFGVNGIERVLTRQLILLG